MKIAKATISILAAGALLGAMPSNAFAQDKKMLEELKQSGIITTDQASSIVKNMTIARPECENSLKFSLWGLTQFVYSYSDLEIGDTSESFDGISLRRMFLGVRAEMEGNWKAALTIDFCRRSTNGSNYLLDCFVTKSFDIENYPISFTLGIKKVQMSYEENLGCANIPAIDSSIVTKYFTYSQNNSRLGMGVRYLGLFCDGDIGDVKGLKYHLAVTNSINNSILMRTHLSGKETNPVNDNNVNLWAALIYTCKPTDDISLTFGAKSGYGASANIISNDKYGAIAEVNPFVVIKYQKDFVLWADGMLANVEYGSRDRQSTARPMGYNVCGEYYFCEDADYGRLSAVVRFSHLFTDGRGVNMKDVLLNSKGATRDRPQTLYFDKAFTIYGGLNWYINGNDMKFQIGYEYANFRDPYNTADNPQANMHIARAQLQVRF
ncbi:MAG: hypothetical protein IKO42_00515 [Opitutales bacterium]|nr:hypothetical protein [Opitutales bacterium]